MIGFFLTFFFIRSEPIYLWDEDKMPAKRTYSESAGYSDPPDFRPIIEYTKAQGKIKGAVLICPGGAFQFRSMYPEGYNVASKLSQLGYQCFVVSYRLRPYTQEEGALDLQRAVRYVRKNSELYGINPKDIAVVGFSAGGILCGELCLNWKDLTNAKKLDSNYVPDDLDQVNSTVSAIGHMEQEILFITNSFKMLKLQEMLEQSLKNMYSKDNHMDSDREMLIQIGFLFLILFCKKRFHLKVHLKHKFLHQPLLFQSQFQILNQLHLLHQKHRQLHLLQQKHKQLHIHHHIQNH